MRHSWCTLACIVAAAMAFAGIGTAQTTFASITGSVTDPNGAVIPGAMVTATRIDNNYKHTVRSNDAGYYTVAQLLEGAYEVRVETAGFKTFLARDIKLANQQVFRLDVHLELGTVETTIEVTAGAALIETESARISDTKTADLIKNMPLNTRSLWNFVGQSPGVLQAVSGTATRRFSGSRNNQSDASVDGITVSNGRDGTQITPLTSYIESFQEVRVDMGNNSAEFGSLGQVTVVSKGGSNQVHGNGFDYYQTPLFIARNPFSLTRDSKISHAPGATIGGPMFIPKVYNGKNKSFFFFSFETGRGGMARDVLNPSVPLANWRKGDFSALLPSTVLKDPFNGNTPFPGNIIPTARINPVSQKIQDLYYPLPNYGNMNVFSSQNYRETKSRPFDPSTYWTTRLDHRFSDSDFLFGRFTWVKQFTRPWDNNLPTIGQIQNQRETQGANVSYSHSFRANLLNEVRWGMAYNDQPRNGNVDGQQMVQTLGLQGLAPNLPDISGLLNVNWNNLGLTKLTQQVWRHPGYKNFFVQFQEQVSWFYGRHTVKAGAMLNRVYYADRQAPANLFGNVTFSNKFTGQSYGDFLLGIPTTAARSFPNFLDRQVRWAYDFFVTDSFKLSPKLTVDMGLRYELHPPVTQMDGYAAMFDIGTGQIVVPDGSLNKVNALMPKSYVNVVGASTVGLPQKLLYTDKNNFAPRLGLAWRPLGNTTVVRAGFGIYYDVVPSSPSMNGLPFAIDEPAFTNPNPNPTVIFPRVFPASASGPATVNIPNALNPHLVIPYSMQYNFTIEHQRGSNAFRISYIGTNTRKGEYAYNINQPIASTVLYQNKPRLFQKYPYIGYMTNGAGHQYNAATAEVKRRGAKGLSYQLAYTLARDIGDLERQDLVENAYDRGRDRGVWVDIPTHRVNGNVSWELPMGKGRRFLSGANSILNFLAGGWSMSGIYSFHSGHFLTPWWTGPDPTNTAYTSGAVPTVTLRPNILLDANQNQTVARWFNSAAFAAPTPGFFGTSAKGVIKGPHVSVFDMGIFKAFPIRERATVRWELTAINVFNHPNYSDPACTLSTSSGVVSTDSACALNITNTGQAGVISGVDGVSSLDPSGARALRMGLRIEF